MQYIHYMHMKVPMQWTLCFLGLVYMTTRFKKKSRSIIIYLTWMLSDIVFFSCHSLSIHNFSPVLLPIILATSFCICAYAVFCLSRMMWLRSQIFCICAFAVFWLPRMMWLRSQTLAQVESGMRKAQRCLLLVLYPGWPQK